VLYNMDVVSTPTVDMQPPGCLWLTGSQMAA
jgi:hypothetical protein